jgi:hypothetical protein
MTAVNLLSPGLLHYVARQGHSAVSPVTGYGIGIEQHSIVCSVGAAVVGYRTVTYHHFSAHRIGSLTW